MRGRGIRSFAVPLAAWAVLAGCAGCTMCPDPHDYSGPVPNGSAPQNDFRLRSNGIIPTGATAMPWPTVVQAAPVRPETAPPTAAPVADVEPLADDAAGAEDTADAVPEADVVRLSAEEDAESSSAAVVQADVEPDPPVAVDRVPAAAPGEVQPAAPADPAPRETPGWRSRR